MSIVITDPEAIANGVAVSADAAAAVSLNVSLASIVQVVVKADTPSSFTSNAGVPDEDAPVTPHFTSRRLKSYGMWNVTFAVPVVIEVVSSEAATTRVSWWP